MGARSWSLQAPPPPDPGFYFILSAQKLQNSFCTAHEKMQSFSLSCLQRLLQIEILLILYHGLKKYKINILQRSTSRTLSPRKTVTERNLIVCFSSSSSLPWLAPSFLLGCSQHISCHGRGASINITRHTQFRVSPCVSVTL